MSKFNYKRFGITFRWTELYLRKNMIKICLGDIRLTGHIQLDYGLQAIQPHTGCKQQTD